MAEAFLAALLRQTLLLAMAAVVLLALRRPVLARFGAGLSYARWALLPLTLLAVAMPVARPEQVVVARFVQQFGPAPVATLALPQAPASSAGLWLAAWLAGTLMLLALMLWQQRRFTRGLTLDGGQWRAASGIGPALVGLLRPRVVLPHDFATRFDATEQRLVLAHEDVHRRRLDSLWNLLAALLCALHWFNPLAWAALRSFRSDQELACDAAVMAAHPGCEAPYGRALLAAQGDALSLLLPWARWTSPHPLIERIAMLDRHPVSRQHRLIGRGLLAASALLAAGLVHAFNAAPVAAPGTQRVRLALHIVAEDPAKGRRTFDPQMIVLEGETGRIVVDGRPPSPANAPMAIELTPSIQADGKLKVAVRFDPSPPRKVQLHAAGLTGSSRTRQFSMVIANNEPGLIKWTDDDHAEVTIQLAGTILKPQP